MPVRQHVPGSMLAHIGDNADHRLLGCRSWQAQKPSEAFNRMKKASVPSASHRPPDAPLPRHFNESISNEFIRAEHRTSLMLTLTSLQRSRWDDGGTKRQYRRYRLRFKLTLGRLRRPAEHKRRTDGIAAVPRRRACIEPSFRNPRRWRMGEFGRSISGYLSI